MTDSSLLQSISELSVEFGTDTHVRGGGGNVSCKTDSVLYIKPSGICLREMRPEKFLPLSRERLNALYAASFSTDETARESEVVSFMAGTVLPDHSGRPSVEAPLHNTFPQRFVVHTHPAIVNGLTCGKGGAEACRALFPDALWIPFIEPGYTVSMRVREEMRRFHSERGRWPDMLFLGNHGLFVAHDEADGIRALYRQAMELIGGVVEAAGLAGEPECRNAPDEATADREIAVIRAVLGKDAAGVAVSGWFEIPRGAITPDHIVYCRAGMFEGPAAESALTSFSLANGCWPRVVATPNAVYGVGTSQKVADLALELAWDGALVVHYAGAFGGIHYLEKRFVDFIANWEVESYRQKVSQ